MTVCIGDVGMGKSYHREYCRLSLGVECLLSVRAFERAVDWRPPRFRLLNPAEAGLWASWQHLSVGASFRLACFAAPGQSVEQTE